VRSRRAALGALVVALAAAGCGGAGAAGSDDGTGGPSDIGGAITVFAAATLAEPFARIAEDFEHAHPGTSVTLSFAGSSTLAQQINQGAPADVFAAAHPRPMEQVAQAGVNGVEPVTFARATLVIAVPPGNPQQISGLADLTRPGVSVALCAEQVPCGIASIEALTAAAVDLVPVTYERDVKAALSKVELGEVDAALVYRADVIHAAGSVTAVEFPEAAQAVNEFQISVLAQAPNPTTAVAFVDFVRSEAGVAVLTAAGYEEA
jgi:molybdate transport system substrate-binding protein